MIGASETLHGCFRVRSEGLDRDSGAVGGAGVAKSGRKRCLTHLAGFYSENWQFRGAVTGVKFALLWLLDIGACAALIYLLFWTCGDTEDTSRGGGVVAMACARCRHLRHHYPTPTHWMSTMPSL